jgi:hypothetical protein
MLSRHPTCQGHHRLLCPVIRIKEKKLLSVFTVHRSIKKEDGRIRRSYLVDIRNVVDTSTINK